MFIKPLMCNSCKTKRGQQTQKANQKVELKRVFDIMGFDTESDVPIYKQFHQKYNLPLKRRDW